MIHRSFLASLIWLCLCSPLPAQISRDAKFEILRTVIADQAAALKEMLLPVLDFNKQTFLKTGVDALPPEFQEAVKAKEAKIGMDRNTVIMALGRPDKKVREKKDGMDVEDWIYFQRGLRAKFVTFENNVVVRIAEY